MKFRTEVSIPKSMFEVTHQHRIAMIGSCFTNNIGTCLNNDKFDVSINPFGILFNPISVANAIEHCANQIFIKKDSLINTSEQWVSLLHHSQFNRAAQEETLKVINHSILEAKDYYNNADLLIITFGTAWIYKYNKTGDYVANCHKIPNKEFTKELLSVTKIVEVYKKLFKSLIKSNPKLNIIFTISPVRHWKDGVVENNQSKATLQLAVKELVEEFDFVNYFPAYEIVLDELRDYRFYKDDMLHPNEVAVAYIYEKFRATYYSEKTILLNKKISKIRLAASHRPFNFEADSHQSFIAKTKLLITQVGLENPYLDFSEELKQLEGLN